jgi:hypothetical protein
MNTFYSSKLFAEKLRFAKVEELNRDALGGGIQFRGAIHWICFAALYALLRYGLHFYATGEEVLLIAIL